MTSTKAEALVEAVNAAVDPVALLNHINFLPEKKVLSGSTLRAACPIHCDHEFLTLFINTRQKTFRCSVNHCSGSEPGSLVHLYALCIEQSDLAAARELVRELKLDINIEEFEQLASDCYEQAEEHLVKLETSYALDLARKAVEIDPNYAPAHRLLVKIYQAQEKSAEAREHAMEAARLMQAAGEVGKAAALLRDFARSSEADETIFQALAHLLRDAGRAGDALQVLEARFNQLDDAGRTGEAARCLEQIVELEPEKRRHRERFAKYLLTIGESEEAANNFKSLAQAAEEEGDLQTALRYLEESLKLNPDFVAALEDKSRLETQAGNAREAVALLLRLAELARDRGDDEERRRAYRRIREIDPTHLEALRRLADLEKESGRPREAAGVLLEAARAALQHKRGHALRDFVREAAALAPEDTEILGKGFEVLGKAGSHMVRLEIGLKYAALLAEENRGDDALEICRILLEENQESAAGRRAIIDFFDERGFGASALQEREALAKKLFADGDDEGVLEIAESGLARLSDEDDPTSFLKYKIESLRRLERAEERDTAILEYFQHFDDLERPGKAERILIQALAADRSPRVFARLFDFYLRRNNAEEALSLFFGNREWLEAVDLASALRAAEALRQKIPENTTAREAYASLLAKTERSDEALEEYRHLAGMYRKEGFLDALESCLRAMLALRPQDRGTGLDLLELLDRRDQRGAVREQTLLLLENPEDWDEASLDRLDRAARRCAEDHTPFLKTYFEGLGQIAGDLARPKRLATGLKLASLLRRENKAKRAAEVLTELAEENPDDKHVAVTMAEAHHAAGEKEESERIIEGLLSGISSEEANDQDRRTLLLALRLFPDREDVLERAADILRPETEGEETVADVFFRLAQIAAKRKDRDREIEHLRSGLAVTAEPRLEERERLLKQLRAAKRSEDYRVEATNFARRLLDGGKIDRARQVALDLKKSDPFEEEPRLILSELYRLKREADLLCKELVELGDLAVTRREWSKAVLHFGDARQISPDDPGILERLAQAHEESGSIDAAVREFEALAEVHRDEGRTDEALRIAEHMAEIAPEATHYLPLLAEIRRLGGKASEAAASHLRMAELAVEEKRPALLKRNAEQIEELTPDDAAAFERLGELFARLELKENAGHHYARAAILLAEKGEKGSVRSACERALAQDPDQIEARKILVNLLRDQGDTNLLLENLRHLAASHSAAGQWGEAIEAYREVLKHAPDDHASRQNLSECYLLAGKPAEARETLHEFCLSLDPEKEAPLLETTGRRLVSIEPGDIEVRLRLADAYRHLGKKMPELDQRARLVAALLRGGRKKEARSHLDRLDELAPESIEALRARALWMENAGPKDSEDAYRRLARVLADKKDYKRLGEIVADLEERVPGEVQWRAPLIVAYVPSGEENRLREMLVALTRDAETARAPEPALQALGEVIEAQPRDILLRQRRAQLLAARGKRAEASLDLQEVARIHAEAERWGPASEAAQEALRLVPEDVEAACVAGGIARSAGDREEAIRCYRAALKALPASGTNAQRRREVLEALNKLQPADAETEEALIEVCRKTAEPRLAAELLIERAERMQQSGDLKTTEQVLRRAVSIDPEFTRSRRLLAENLAEQRRHEEAREEYLLLAQQFDAANNPALAIQYLMRASDVSPDHPESFLRLGHLYARQNNHRQAGKCFERGINLLLQTGQLERAIEILESVAEVSPEAISLHRSVFTTLFSMDRATDASREGLRLARFYLRQGDVVQARLITDKLLCLRHRSVDFFESVAEVYREFEYYDEALECYRTGAAQCLQEDRYEGAARLAEAALGLKTGEKDLLELLVDAREAADPPQPEALREARLRLVDHLASQKGREAKAEELEALDTVLRSEKEGGLAELHLRRAGLMKELGRNFESDELLGNFIRWMAKKKPAEAIQFLNDLRALIPSYTPAHRRLADLYIEQGEMERAQRALLELAEVHQKLGDSGEEEAVLLELLKHDAGSIPALKRLMDISRRRQDVARLWQLGLKLAALYEGMGQREHARRIYEEAVMMDGDNLEAWAKMAEIAESSNDPDQMTNIYKNMARGFENRGDKERALSYYEKVLELNPRELTTALDAAELAINEGDAERATSILERALESSEDLTAGEAELLEEVCRRTLVVTPDSTRVRRRLALLLEEREAHDQAAEEWSLLASYYRIKGQPEKALEALERKAEISGSLWARRDYARSLFAEGQPERAREIYENVLASTDDNDDRIELVCEVADLFEKNAGAQERAADALKGVGDDPRRLGFLRRLARIALSEGNIELAKRALKPARKIASDDLEVRLLLADLAKATDNPERAVEILEKVASEARKKGKEDLAKKADRKLKAARRKQATTAATTSDDPEASSDSKPAEERIREARRALKRGKVGTATALAEELLADPGCESEPIAEFLARLGEEANAEAARVLEVRLARRCLERDEAELANRILDRILESSPNHVEALRMSADLSSDDPTLSIEKRERLAQALVERGDFEEAEGLLQGLANEAPGRSRVQELLGRVSRELGKERVALEAYRRAAELLEEEGLDEKAHELLGRILEIDAEDLDARRHRLDLAPAFLPTEAYQDEYIALGRRLVEAGRLEEAEALLEEARQLAPDFGPLDDLRLSLLERQGRGEEAKSAALEQSRALQEEGSIDDAVGRLTELVRQQPDNYEAHLLLADLYREQGKRDLARQELESCLDLAGDDEKELRLEAAEKLHEIEPENVRNLEMLVDLCFEMSRRERAVQHAMELGKLLQKRHHPERAEEVFRRIIDEDPHELQALEQMLVTMRHTASPEKLADECYDQAGRLLALSQAETNDRFRIMANSLIGRALKRVPDSPRYLATDLDCRMNKLSPEQIVEERVKIGKLAVEKGLLGEAREQLEAARELAPAGHAGVKGLEDILGRTSAYTPTPENELPEAVELDQKESTAAEQSEAIQNFHQVLRLDPDNIDVHQALALVYRQMGNDRGELVHQKEVARLLETHGRWDELLSHLQELIRQYPGDTELGEILRRVRLKVRTMNLLEGNETQSGAGL